MTFNSVAFFFFLIVVVGIYWAVSPKRRNFVLLVASYTFYGLWDWRFLSLLVISTLVDFVVGRRLHRAVDEQVRLRLLATSILVNLGMLGVFKYANFFVDGFADLLEATGLEADRVTLEFVLPVGISFYTFQTMSYTFDIYRRRIDPAATLLDFGTYVAYFPQLVAGPIERAQRLLPQITRVDRPFPRGPRLEEAAGLITLGLLKKVVLADGVARVADTTFSDPNHWSWLALAAGVLAFSVQIYGDFSGYTDIARGVSMLFGIDLVLNFSQPYLSRNITEFWRRWHISLSDWLRDYLYIPLGGNRGSAFATYRNLMLTMLLGGLWHGASWNFVIWGGLHGLFLVIHKLTMGGRMQTRQIRWIDVPSMLATNFAVLTAWVFFRASTLDDAFSILRGMATLQRGATSQTDLLLVAVMATATVTLDLWQRLNTPGGQPRRASSAAAAGIKAGAAVTAVLVFSGGTPTPFIYFQF